MRDCGTNPSVTHAAAPFLLAVEVVPPKVLEERGAYVLDARVRTLGKFLEASGTKKRTRERESIGILKGIAGFAADVP